MALGSSSGGMRLRPLEISDVLDETFRIYRKQFVAFVVAMGVVVVPTAVLSLALQLLVGTSAMGTRSDSATSAIVALVVALPIGIVSGLARVVAFGAATQIASDTILGRPVDVSAAYRHAFSKLGSLLWSGLLVGLAVALLFITCLGIPFAIYLGLGWSLVYPAILLEGRGGIEGMRRSRELVNGHRWRLLICSVLIGLIAILLVSIPAGLFAFVTGILVAMLTPSPMVMMGIQAGNIVVQAIGETVFGAIGYVVITLFYYDLRVRKEAFDLQQRAAYGEPTPGQSIPSWQQPSPYDQYYPGGNQPSGAPPYQPPAPPSYQPPAPPSYRPPAPPAYQPPYQPPPPPYQTPPPPPGAGQPPYEPPPPAGPPPHPPTPPPPPPWPGNR